MRFVAPDASVRRGFEAALDWLEQAAEERHLGFHLPVADPFYQPLHTNPRFLALMQRVHAGLD